MTQAFPGSRWPIFTAWGAGPLYYVLNEAGQLEVPTRTLYGYEAEPSGRVVGFQRSRAGPQLYIQNPENGRFVALDGTDAKTIGMMSNAAWISSRNATLIATSTGLFTLTADPVPTVRPLVVTGAAVNKIRWIDDLPLHRAAAIGAAGSSAFVLSSDNRVREIPGFQMPRYGGTRFREIGDPDRLLIEADTELWMAPLSRDGDATIPGRAGKITSYVFEGNVLQYYPAIHQYLVYARSNGWLPRPAALLELRDGLAPVADSTGLDHPHIRNIASRGIVTIETFQGGIFTYDGKNALKHVAHSAAADIGAYPRVYDLTSQGKVLVLTTRGLYELDHTDHLNRLPLPAELEGAAFGQIAELPASHAAVVFSDRGAFALDSAGTLSPILGGSRADLGPGGVDLVTRIPIRETLFVSTPHLGSFMVLDESKVGRGACAVTR